MPSLFAKYARKKKQIEIRNDFKLIWFRARTKKAARPEGKRLVLSD